MSRLADALQRAGEIPVAGAEIDDQTVPPADVPAAETAAVETAAAQERVVEEPAVVAPIVETAADPGTAVEEQVPPQETPAAPAIFHGFEPQVAERLVVTEDVSMVSLEQYRNLAAVLHHAQVDKGIKVVMVASALAGEGKTLTTVNLALTLSGSYRRRVLIIDADLRKPSMHGIFQVPNTAGLSDAFRNDQPRKVKIFEISPNLSLLTAGPPGPDPMSLLTSDRIRLLMAEAAARYDWVIIDTPPVGLLTDANLLGVMSDASVLVVRAGLTPHRLIKRAADTLGRDRIVGVVLNAVEPQTLTSTKYYPYYYGRQAAAH